MFSTVPAPSDHTLGAGRPSPSLSSSRTGPAQPVAATHSTRTLGTPDTCRQPARRKAAEPPVPEHAEFNTKLLNSTKNVELKQKILEFNTTLLNSSKKY
jgi:hypothetical protein